MQYWNDLIILVKDRMIAKMKNSRLFVGTSLRARFVHAQTLMSSYFVFFRFSAKNNWFEISLKVTFDSCVPFSICSTWKCDWTKKATRKTHIWIRHRGIFEVSSRRKYEIPLHSQFVFFVNCNNLEIRAFFTIASIAESKRTNACIYFLLFWKFDELFALDAACCYIFLCNFCCA